MSSITLTPSQLEQIKTDMSVTVKMLTDEEVMALAKKASEKVKIPFLSDEKEQIVLCKIIHWIDKELYQLLPNEYYALVHDATDGISPDEAKEIKARLVPLINNVIDIPILSEGMEAFLIELVLGLIIDAMVTGFNLTLVVAATK